MMSKRTQKEKEQEKIEKLRQKIKGMAADDPLLKGQQFLLDRLLNKAMERLRIYLIGLLNIKKNNN